MNNIEKRNIIKQSNEIITSRYKLSIQEQKFILLILTKINTENENFKDYKITIKELFNREIIKDTNIKNLKIFCTKLLDKKLHIKTEKGFIESHWIAVLEYIKEENNAFLEVSIHQKMKPYLLQLSKNFTRYEIKNIIKMKSKYSIRIYQMLKQFEKLGKRNFIVNELMEILDVTQSLRRYSNFNRKVLKIAQEEINNLTDIQIEIIPIKKERKEVITIQFIITKNKNYKKDQNKNILENFLGNNILIKNNEIEEITKIDKIYFKEEKIEINCILNNKNAVIRIENIDHLHQIICET